MNAAAVTAIASYVPSKVLNNHDLEKMVDTNDEWIVQRTGISERRIAADDQFASDLAYQAAKGLEEQGHRLDDVDLIIAATLTPDHKTPSVASLVQGRLNIRGCGAFDLNGACAGFVYALQVANSLIATGQHRKVLVVATETLSKVVDYTDRTTCVLFGDGAGAALVEHVAGDSGFLAAHVDSEGELSMHLYGSHLADRLLDQPITANGCLVQNGREVYKWAVTRVPQGISRILDGAGVSVDDLDWFVPHSANLKMIGSIAERSGIAMEKTLYSLVQYGNTSAATIPLALDLARQQGRLRDGQLLLLYGFGGGLTQSGLLIRWGRPLG